MLNSRSTSRREMLIASSAALVGASCGGAEVKRKRPVCVFTKPFNSLTFDELADRIAEIGFSGLEAPIRKGGHVQPEAVEDQLPALVEALRKRNLEITVMASDINDPTDPLTEKVLRTASTLGIKRYRMKYLRYDLDRPVMKQIREWQPKLRDLGAMNAEFGIRAVYQNHAGSNHLGATLWDLPYVLKGIPREQISVAYDIRHATVEGGMSWPITFNRIRPHIDTVYVKDFVWSEGKPKNVPLGQGLVDRRFFRMLTTSQFDGPVSLHEEYLDHRNPELVPRHLQAMKKDLATLLDFLG